MTNTYSNLRKAAVLIRSLDADSAARLLAQLSSSEAARVREAIRALGRIDPEEQADILAEFRRARPTASESAGMGVELSLSEPAGGSEAPAAAERPSPGGIGKRFAFLENAPTAVLVSHLSREHAQTIAVVLAHLAPAHAAEVLAALPPKLQADAVERLFVLGEADSQVVAALESELAAWVAKRAGGRTERRRRGDIITAILATADAKSRNAILANLSTDKAALLNQTAPAATRTKSKPNSTRLVRKSPIRPRPLTEKHDTPRLPAASPQNLPRIDFEHLIHLDDQTLATVLREVDADALALALAGSGDELVERICTQMPRRTAKMFRRELRRLGPTRLSDVEAAQRLVAHVAARQLAQRRTQHIAPV